MFGYLKEKFRMTVYKAVIVEKVGESKLTVPTSKKVKKEVEGKTVDVDEVQDVEVVVPRYRVLKVRYVNPDKAFFKQRIGSMFSRSAVTKALPIDFAYESYYHNEKHVMFIEWNTGRAIKMGGGLVDYANPPRQEQMTHDLMSSVSFLIKGRNELMLILMALGLGVFVGIFIGQTLLPMLAGAV